MKHSQPVSRVSECEWAAVKKLNQTKIFGDSLSAILRQSESSCSVQGRMQI